MSDPLAVMTILPATLGAMLGFWHPRSSSASRWLLAFGIVLIAVGFLFIFTIGILLLPLGIALMSVVAGSILRTGLET